MDLRADIKWIKSELNKVTDPHLIEAFKQMLAYRKSKQSITSTTDLGLQTALIKAISQANEGNVKPHTEIRKKYQKWL